MARSRRAPSSSSHSAPPPAPPKPQSHTHQTSSAHQQQQPQQPQVTNIYVQRPAPAFGGGGGTGILGTVASVAAGSVIGHGVSHMLFNRSEPPQQPAQAQEMAQKVGDGACKQQIKSYTQCLEANEGHADNCKWVWDAFVQCQDAQPQQS